MSFPQNIDTPQNSPTMNKPSPSSALLDLTFFSIFSAPASSTASGPIPALIPAFPAQKPRPYQVHRRSPLARPPIVASTPASPASYMGEPHFPAYRRSQSLPNSGAYGDISPVSCVSSTSSSPFLSSNVVPQLQQPQPPMQPAYNPAIAESSYTYFSNVPSQASHGYALPQPQKVAPQSFSAWPSHPGSMGSNVHNGVHTVNPAGSVLLPGVSAVTSYPSTFLPGQVPVYSHGQVLSY